MQLMKSQLIEKRDTAQRNQRQAKTVENKPHLTNERLFSSIFHQSIADN